MTSFDRVRAMWGLIVGLAAFQIAAHFSRETVDQYLWDLRVYARAMDQPDPYDVRAELLFVYGPMVADAFRLTRSHLFEALLTAYVGATIWFVSEFTQLSLMRPGLVFLVAFSTAGLGTVSFMSGNVTAFLHLAILAALFRWQRLRRGEALVLSLIATLSVVKPYLLLLLLLVPLLAADRRRALIRTTVAAMGVVAIYAAYMVWHTDEMIAFQAALSTQVFVRADYGSNVYGLARTWFSAPGASTIFTGVAIVIVLAAAVVRRHWRHDPRAAMMMLLVGYATLTLINPRAHVYDLFPVLLCLVAACDVAGWPLKMQMAVMAAALVGASPALIAEFARDPESYPAILRNYTVAQLVGIAVVLGSLARHAPATGR